MGLFSSYIFKEQNLVDEMICANGKHKCLISMDKIDNEDVVKLEFNITEYRVYTNDWINYNLPIQQKNKNNIKI